MHKYQKKILLALWVLILFCSYAAASSSAIPSAVRAKTFVSAVLPANTTASLSPDSSHTSMTTGIPAITESHLDGAQPLLASPNSTSKPANIIYATQQLGSLAAIAWNNLDTPIYPPAFSQILILPTNDEFGDQSGVLEETTVTSTNEPIVDDALFQRSDLADALFVSMDTHREVAITCTACHSVPETSAPIITALNYQQSIEQQDHPGSIVDCAICHRQKPQQISRHFRGVQ